MYYVVLIFCLESSVIYLFFLSLAVYLYYRQSENQMFLHEVNPLVDLETLT